MKKTGILIFSFFILHFILILTFKPQAVYVLDTRTLIDCSNEVIEEIGDADSVINELNSAIDIIESEFDEGIPHARTMIEKAKAIRDRFRENHQFLENNYDIEFDLAKDLYIGTALALFWNLGAKLSFELLLQSYILTMNGTNYNNPYFGYVIDDSNQINEIAHNTAVSGNSSFPFSSDLTKIKENDLFFSIHNFSYTKSSSSSLSVVITDIYDFETNYTSYGPIFNKILNTFGSLMETNVLHSFGISYTATHNSNYTYTKLSDDQHRKTCSCGRSWTENHYFTVYRSAGIALEPNYVADRYRCKYCGFIKITTEL